MNFKFTQKKYNKNNSGNEGDLKWMALFLKECKSFGQNTVPDIIPAIFPPLSTADEQSNLFLDLLLFPFLH